VHIRTMLEKQLHDIRVIFFRRQRQSFTT